MKLVYRSKIFNLIISGLLPLFLLSVFVAPGAQAATGEVQIIFDAPAQHRPNLIAQYNLTDVQAVFTDSKQPQFVDVYKARLEAGLLSDFKLDPRVNYVQRDTPLTATTVTTSDPYFTLDSNLEDKQWYLPKIRLPEAWEYGRGSFTTKVAIIDTGIYGEHLELNDGRIIGGYNTVENLVIPPQANSDDNGHGTAVAGVIGAITDNNAGMAGINWEVSLMPLKALQGDGTGEISDVSEAIVWAVDHGAHIINLSLGGPGFGADLTMNNAIAYAYNNNVLVISAAGNDLAEHGNNLDTNPVYPICADQGKNMVLGVAASDTNDHKAGFSNFGINCVDITAPGKKILTTSYFPSDPKGSFLIYGSGTSLATPVVAGVAALLKSNNHNLTNVQIRDVLIRSTDNIDALNTNNCLNTNCAGFLGKGRLSALFALTPQPLLDGTFIREVSTNKIYQIKGGIKQYVSSFVFQQRGFDASQVNQEYNNQLQSVPLGEAVPPLDGTLIKAVGDPTVYVIHQGVRRPLTFLVFQSRGYSFADVKEIPLADTQVIKLSEWYWPPDETTVLINGDPTVYVMDQGVRRPVTYFVFTQRKLSFAKVVTVSTDEFSHIPKPVDAYWMPPTEGTLVKSQDNPTVYLITDRSRKPLSGTAFINRKFSYSNIVSLPQAEIDVILPGSPILN